MAGIIEANHSIGLAADVEPEAYEDLISQLEGVEGVDFIKVGFELGLGMTLATASDIAHAAGKVSVYDHQKAGTDIDKTSLQFGRTMERGKVDAAILFPFTGPVVQEKWTRELQDRGVTVISGGEMTHEGIRKDEGGYFTDEDFVKMYMNAVNLGVRDFVVPGNKPERVSVYKFLFDREIGEGKYTLWAPGFVDQGGDVTETGLLAGPNFNAIVGTGIYGKESPRQAAIDLGQKILALNKEV